MAGESQRLPYDYRPRRLAQKGVAVSALLATLIAATAGAQDAPVAPVAEPPPDVVVAVPPPKAPSAVIVPVVAEPAAEQVAEQTPPVTTAPSEERATEPPPPDDDQEPPFTPKLTIGIGLRAGLSLAFNPGDDVNVRLSDSLDQLMFRPFFAGQLTRNIGVFVQMEATANNVQLLDGYFEVEFVKQFQLLLGQHIPANDRNNFSGPFFNNSWNFAAVHSFPFDAGARDRGFTFWGLLANDVIKYHLSMVELQPGRKIENARFAGRLNFNFLDKETSYYASDTYFGKQDTLSIGGLVSYQKGVGASDGGEDVDMDGEIDNDFLGFAVDALFEKNLGSPGTITLQAGYWNWDGTGADYVNNQGTSDSGKGFVGALNGIVLGQSYQVAASWLSAEKLGIGQIQPNIRVQGFDEDAGDTMIYDVGIGYIVDGFNHLWRLNYRHVERSDSAPPGDEDSIQLGAQMQI